MNREALAEQIYIALYTSRRSAPGAFVGVDVGELAAEAMAVAQTFAAHACRQFGHTYGGEGHTHEHECSRCGGDISTLVNADRAEWTATQKSKHQATVTYFQPKRVYIGDCD